MLHKYIRTPHLVGSRKSLGDDLEDVSFNEISGKHLVVEEKIDGANCGISFEDGSLKLQSRGHYLVGGPRERQFDILKAWATTHAPAFQELLQDKWVMYGEWMYAKHTCFYDMLPHYFMEFDIMNKETGEFLSTDARNDMITKAGCRDKIKSVHVLDQDKYENIEQLKGLIKKSVFKSDVWLNSLKTVVEDLDENVIEVINHTDMSDDAEGLYIKWEENGVVKGRYKLVRESFTNAILNQEQHWSERTIIPNVLDADAYQKMFI